MSLIIDALKKAQHLRLKEGKRTPFFKAGSPEKNRKRTAKRKRQAIIGSVLASFLVLLIFVLRPFSYSPTSKPEQTALFKGTEHSGPEPQKITVAPSSEGASVPKNTSSHSGEISTPSGTDPGPVLIQRRIDHPSDPPLEKSPSDGTLLNDGTAKGVSVKQATASKKMDRGNSPDSSIRGKSEDGSSRRTNEGAAAISFPPAAPASLREGTLPNGIGVKQENEKEENLSSETLRQFNIGVSAHAQRELTKAIQAYRRVIETDPGYVEAYNNLGIIYQEVGDPEQAFKAYHRAIEINPLYEKAFNNLGLLYFSKDRHEEAREAFEKALAINPNNIETHINLGILFKKQGQTGKAIEAFHKALAINPLYGEIHYNIGLLYEHMEHVDLAIGHYRRFLQLSSASHPMLASKVERHLDTLVKGRPHPRR